MTPMTQMVKCGVKLSDLNAQFVNGGAGLCFDCPRHPDGNCRLFVAFANPIGGAPQHYMAKGHEKVWDRAGETIAELTLAQEMDFPEHWKGWIKNGETKVRL